MNIKWNEYTWYSKLGAVILFVGIVPVITFYIGIQYEKTREVLENPISMWTIHAESIKEERNFEPYLNKSLGFQIDLPAASSSTLYKINEEYTYSLPSGKKIKGIKFSIPNTLSEGTNLSNDSYISVESQNIEKCSARAFLEGENLVYTTDSNKKYSVASSIGAAAGNRYEEIVYALEDSSPCIAVRYFIHYSAIQNYAPGTVIEFNRNNLLFEFNLIRKSLKIIEKTNLNNPVQPRVSTLRGITVCLPHIDSSGPQTLECAFGLKTEKGEYFGLKDTDPNYKNIIGIPNNELVDITGNIVYKKDSKYQSIGVIEVTSIKALER